MSTEFERRVKSLERLIGAGTTPCRKHWPAIIYRRFDEGDERIEALLAEMDECPQCGSVKLGGGPRLLVIGLPRGVIAPLALPHSLPLAPADDGEFIESWPVNRSN